MILKSGHHMPCLSIVHFPKEWDVKILKLVGLDDLFINVGHLLLHFDGKHAFYVGTRIL
jgi:hypothetical protein